MTTGYNTDTCNSCIAYCGENNIMRPCEYGICILEYEKQSEEIGDVFRIIAKRIRNFKEVDLEITNKSKHISKIELKEGEINYDWIKCKFWRIDTHGFGRS